MTPTFWELARKPKWLAGLAFAILTAVVFSLLMQWQLSRTFNVVGVDVSEAAPAPLSEMIAPGELRPNVYDRLATATIQLEPEQSYIISDRLQLVDGEQVRGYWLIAKSNFDGSALTLALGFSEQLERVRAEQAKLSAGEYEVLGYVEPSEPPKSANQDGTLGSLSLGQLANLYSNGPLSSWPAYLIVQQGIETDLDPISIEIRQQEIEINWLTAFYAVEWAFFAIAAFYIWWRLVRDEQLRLAQEG
jgi:cytochrome oxidase assembly protein ShyY1